MNNFLLPAMFYWIDERMNDSDEVLILVHQKNLMSRIIQKLYSIERTTTPTFLLPTIFDWINKRANGCDGVWWNLQNNEWDWWSMKASAEKYLMSQIIKKFN